MPQAQSPWEDERLAATARLQVEPLAPERALHVWRDGRRAAVAPDEVVVGDLLLLRSGQQLPADGRVLATVDAEGVISGRAAVDMASLTGESEPMALQPRPTHSHLLESRNAVFAFTSLVQGHAAVLVYATGSRTVMGAIASLIAQPMRERLPRGVSRRKTARAARLLHARRQLVVRSLQACDMLTRATVLLVPEALWPSHTRGADVEAADGLGTGLDPGTMRLAMIPAGTSSQTALADLRRRQQAGQTVGVLAATLDFAPLLKCADLGVALSTADDVSMQAADAVLGPGLTAADLVLDVRATALECGL